MAPVETLALRPAPMRAAVRDYFANPVETNTPTLTEVVLATLLEKAGLPFECMSLDAVYSDHTDKLVEALRLHTGGSESS